MFGVISETFNGTQKELIKFRVEYYDKFSIISDIDDGSFFYFPNKEHLCSVSYTYSQWYSKSSVLNSLEPLHDITNEETDYYLVTEPLIRFKSVSRLSLNNKYDDGYEDIDDNIIYGVYSDIKDNEDLYNFDNYRKSHFYVTSLVGFEWSHGYDDSDCEVVYIGLIDDILESTLSKVSQTRISKTRKESVEYEKKFYSELVSDTKNDEFMF